MDDTVFCTKINDIQKIVYSRFDSRKYKDKSTRIYRSARRNLILSSLIVSGDGIICFKNIIAGSIVIGVGMYESYRIFNQKKCGFKNKNF